MAKVEGELVARRGVESEGTDNEVEPTPCTSPVDVENSEYMSSYRSSADMDRLVVEPRLAEDKAARAGVDLSKAPSSAVTEKPDTSRSRCCERTAYRTEMSGPATLSNERETNYLERREAEWTMQVEVAIYSDMEDLEYTSGPLSGIVEDE